MWDAHCSFHQSEKSYRFSIDGITVDCAKMGFTLTSSVLLAVEEGPTKAA